MKPFFSSSIPNSTEIEIDGRLVAVRVRTNARARHYRLTIARDGQPVMTVPDRGRWQEAERFLFKHRVWLAARLDRGPKRVQFEPGAIIPLRGEEHEISGTGRVRGTVRIEMGEKLPRLAVPGAPEHLPRRLTDWLKAEALRDIEVAVAIHAETLKVRPTAIRVRDQSSRWGSCASSGRLNFNWRLVLAPPFVLDYVAAHEVAHMVEMNHSPAFWSAVTRTLPDMERGRSWLKAHGASLMRIGLAG